MGYEGVETSLVGMKVEVPIRGRRPGERGVKLSQRDNFDSCIYRFGSESRRRRKSFIKEQTHRDLRRPETSLERQGIFNRLDRQALVELVDCWSFEPTIFSEREQGGTWHT